MIILEALAFIGFSVLIIMFLGSAAFVLCLLMQPAQPQSIRIENDQDIKEILQRRVEVKKYDQR
tara:strand:- start:701 stop:892 length:192 start_codon:yes stop_codon:yes gene_type:complete